jgi:hypothetical protein
MPNSRIYYASQTAQVRPQTATPTSSSDIFNGWYQPLGLQSVSMTTNFALEPAFQLGTVELYDNVESIPEVEVTLNRVIDTTAPLYLMCMGGKDGVDGAENKQLVSLANNRVNFRLGVYESANQFISNVASQYVVCSGMYLSNFNYTIPIEGNATEEVTLVGNHKIWNTGAFLGDSSFNVSNIFNPSTTVGAITPTTASGILRKQYVDIISSTLPIGPSGIRQPGGNKMPHFQNITISASLGRESINQLGRFAPYCRYTNFPIEVTSEFEVMSTDGDGVDADDFLNQSFCNGPKSNLKQHPIKIVICDGDSTTASNSMALDLGNKNTLTSINQTGGDTGGGNVMVTYSFRNFNNFTIQASGTYKDGLKIASGSLSMQSLPESNPVVPVTQSTSYNYLDTDQINNSGD